MRVTKGTDASGTPTGIRMCVVCEQADELEGALCLLEEMRGKNVTPPATTISSVIAA